MDTRSKKVLPPKEAPPPKIEVTTIGTHVSPRQKYYDLCAYNHDCNWRYKFYPKRVSDSRPVWKF